MFDGWETWLIAPIRSLRPLTAGLPQALDPQERDTADPFGFGYGRR